MEFGLGVGQKDDFKLALLTLGEYGAGDLDLLSAAGGVLEGEGTGTADLKAIVEDCAGSEAIDAEAGAGVVDLEKLNVSAGTIHDGRVDVVGVAG